MPSLDMTDFIRGLPKAELHVHLEGTLEPQMLFDLATRNGLRPRWESPEALAAAYHFRNLQSFLDLYYEGCRVLVTERDFYDVTRAYLQRAIADGVRRAEMFLGPQSFTSNGMNIASILQGVVAAIDDTPEISGGLLVSAQRHRTEDEALALLDSVMPWADRIAGIGLGGAELGNPPLKFARYFAAARERGFRITIHAGEEGPAAFVRDAIDALDVDRIDHGVACWDDPALVRDLAARGTPLTVCPLSNVRLRVVPTIEAHPLAAMLRAGLRVTVNSDDPPYFGGYVVDNFLACQRAFDLTRDEIAMLARNSFAAAFLPQNEIAAGIEAVDAWCAHTA